MKKSNCIKTFVSKNSKYKIKEIVKMLFLVFHMSMIFNVTAQVSFDGTYNLKGSEDGASHCANYTYKQNYKHRIPSPVGLVLSIAFDGEHLWVGGYNDSSFYKISRVDGTILKKIVSNNIMTPRGMTFFDGSLWVMDSDSCRIHKIDTANGTIVETIYNIYCDIDSDLTGITWDGSNIWYIDGNCPTVNSTNLYVIDSVNVSSKVFSFQSGSGGGLTWDGNSFWYSDNHHDKIYKVDKISYEIVETLDAPGGDYPNGVAWDGEYLWLANGYSDSIYQLEVNSNAIHSQPESAKELFFSALPATANSDLKITLKLNQSGKVRLTIVDMSGREIKSLHSSVLPSGFHSFIWRGRDNDLNKVSFGIFLIVLNFEKYTFTKKIIWKGN